MRTIAKNPILLIYTYRTCVLTIVQESTLHIWIITVMNAKFIVFVSYFVINCKISFQYFCKNREIDVLGTVSVTEYDVYDTLSYYFLDLRRNYEINSFIQPIITSLNSLPNVNNQNGTDSPIVFSTFPQQFETDKEELVLPLMAQ